MQLKHFSSLGSKREEEKINLTYKVFNMLQFTWDKWKFEVISQIKQH